MPPDDTHGAKYKSKYKNAMLPCWVISSTVAGSNIFLSVQLFLPICHNLVVVGMHFAAVCTKGGLKSLLQGFESACHYMSSTNRVSGFLVLNLSQTEPISPKTS